jgi:DHA2 family multidrug resistance protein
MLRRIDYAHLLSMAVFLGGLEYVLEEGPRHDWLNEPKIAVAAWLSCVAFGLFIERSFRSNGPIVKLTPFRNPTFAFACLFNLVIGFGIYSATYLVPLYLGRVRGYNSLEIGETVFITGIAQIFSTVIAARLSQRIDMRIMITVGLSLFAASLWSTSYLTKDWGFGALLWPQVLRGFASMLCIVPAVNMALAGFAMTELRYASGLFNLMRNLGGAIGIATVTTWLQDNSRIQFTRLGESLGEPSRVIVDWVGRLTQLAGQYTPDAAQGLLVSQAELARFAMRDALTLAFNDGFRLMSWMFIAALIMVPLCRPAKPQQPRRG